MLLATRPMFASRLGRGVLVRGLFLLWFVVLVLVLVLIVKGGYSRHPCAGESVVVCNR
jgi:hypothetical protein